MLVKKKEDDGLWKKVEGNPRKNCTEAHLYCKELQRRLVDAVKLSFLFCMGVLLVGGCGFSV